ncbi:hypothetical protein [Nonomuraea salmonea]|uniref:TolB family protein n=1 Tax=Nonomuraea salmonea TaxID=46181 RepID=UPI002FEB41C9
MLTEELVVDARLPVGPAISPDGRRVAYGEMPGRTIWVVAVDGGAPPRELGQGIDPKWSPDSRYVYFRTEGQLHREPVEGGGRRSWSGEAAAYLPLADHHTVAVLSPDPGESDPWVWSEAAGRHRLRLLDVRSGEVYTPEVFQGRHVAEVAERPGGGMLAVLTQESPDPGDLRPRLHLFDPATGETRELGACAVPAGSLTWWEAVDGWHVAYVATTPPGPVGGNAVLDVALTDGKHRNLTEGLPFCPLTLTSGGLVLVADGLDAAIHRLDPVTRRLAELLRLTGQAFWLTADADGATVAVARSEAYEPRSVFAGPVQGPLVRRTDTAPELRAIGWGAQERLSYRGGTTGWTWTACSSCHLASPAMTARSPWSRSRTAARTDAGPTSCSCSITNPRSGWPATATPSSCPIPGAARVTGTPSRRTAPSAARSGRT